MNKFRVGLELIAAQEEANRERQRRLKARRNAAGFHQTTEWVHDEDRAVLKEFARCLRAKRFGGVDHG